jgi:hypothetical protein
MGCLLSGLIILGISCVLLLGFCALVTQGPSERDKRAKQAQDDAEDASAQARAKQVAELEAQWRKECKLAATAPVFVAYGDDMIDRCQEVVRRDLKVPGSGDFPGPRDEDRSTLHTAELLAAWRDDVPGRKSRRGGGEKTAATSRGPGSKWEILAAVLKRAWEANMTWSKLQKEWNEARP